MESTHQPRDMQLAMSAMNTYEGQQVIPIWQLAWPPCYCKDQYKHGKFVCLFVCSVVVVFFFFADFKHARD